VRIVCYSMMIKSCVMFTFCNKYLCLAFGLLRDHLNTIFVFSGLKGILLCTCICHVILNFTHFSYTFLPYGHSWHPGLLFYGISSSFLNTSYKLSLSLLLFRRFVNCVILVKLIKYWCHFYSYSCNVCPFSCTSSLVQNVLKNQPADVCPSETKTES
jgi:hypothetical protein